MSSESMPTNPPMSNLQESSHLFKAEIFSAVLSLNVAHPLKKLTRVSTPVAGQQHPCCSGIVVPQWNKLAEPLANHVFFNWSFRVCNECLQNKEFV